MARIEIEEHDGWRRALFVRGRGNALDAGTLHELELLFGPAGGDAPAVILSGRGRSFCTGLDLDHVLELERGAMREFMGAFHRALRACFAYPAPVVAALNGHALAGGALLALACDRRIMARGRSRFGIHGVKMGIAYPDVAVEILRHQLPRPQREDTLYRGRILGDVEALRQGLVDDLVEETELEARAYDELAQLCQPGVASFARHKRAHRGEPLRRLRHLDERGMELWLDRWFDPRTREAIRAALGPAEGET